MIAMAEEVDHKKPVRPLTTRWGNCKINEIFIPKHVMHPQILKNCEKNVGAD